MMMKLIEFIFIGVFIQYQTPMQPPTMIERNIAIQAEYG